MTRELVIEVTARQRLVVAADRDDATVVVISQDTLAVREHRGHQLGQLIKAVNLERLAELRPGARRVHTWNAKENSFMLAINVALGFEPVGVYGVWQKHLG